MTQVTIIGAGPTGLLAAINLVKSGVKIRIFESRSERSPFSKALAIHAGTLELLEETHPDLLKKFLARGKKIQHLQFGEKYEIDVSIIPSKYNFVLMIEQNESEELLESYLESLGTKVEMSCQLINATNHSDKVTSFIKTIDGSLIINSDYLLDCSGAHSVIRKDILQIPFRGEKYLGTLVMGDIKLNTKLSDDKVRLVSSDKGFAGFVPLNEASYFRVILIPHIDLEIPKTISIDYFHNLAKIIAPEIDLSSENKWLTSFEISKRLASKLRVDRIFLAGDAAHVHSPVGGQGMNLGMQDAFNISHKLKRVLIDGYNAKILDNYEKERLPIILNVLRTTNAAMRSGVEKSWIGAVGIFMLKNLIAPIFFRSKFLQKKLATLVSQIKSARQEIARLKL